MGTVKRLPTKLPPGGIVSGCVLRGHCKIPDPLIERMKKLGIPVTYENYVAIATNDGELEWTAEHDDALPDELRWEAP
jgi:hypothetical protein